MNIDGIRIGHSELANNASGVTVILCDRPAVCSMRLMGSAPASRDALVAAGDSTVSKVNGLMFAGGSAFGVGASNGVLNWLRERERGLATPGGIVPIVPAAGIYDLTVGAEGTPEPQHAYQACEQATTTPAQGRVGAGVAASVGKYLRHGHPMQGGFGFAECKLPQDIVVSAAVVVNALGDVVNDRGEIVAGAVDDNGEFLDTYQQIVEGQRMTVDYGINTTLVAVMTNAKLDAGSLARVTKMASSGMARAIRPVFTSLDGDIIFALSVGEHDADEVSIGTAAAEAVRQAIINAVEGAQRI